MKVLTILLALLCATLPVQARAPNSGAEYFRLQTERVAQQMDSSIRPKANPAYPTIYSTPRPVRAPWRED